MRRLLLTAEVLLFVALIILPRCCNRDQVFFGDAVYFVDADCYSRMSRVQLCWQHPGLVVRHHEFENFPDGTSPHTTAPFDYAIILLALALKPFCPNPVELAGAFVSPLLGLIAGLFLWWWGRLFRFRYRWAALFLYAFSPILVHGTSLGRPDHQSLLISILLVALCAEWALAVAPTRAWRITAGISWGFALWVSLYEPLLLFVVARVLSLLWRRRLERPNQFKFGKPAWLSFFTVIALALAVERRLPSFTVLAEPMARNWARTIGELRHVPLVSPVWFQWCSFLLVIGPLVYFLKRTRASPGSASNVPLRMMLALLLLLLCLTMWQVRWAYFLLVVFIIVLPALLEPIRQRAVAWVVVFLSFWPVAKSWDETLWPNDELLFRRTAEHEEQTDLRVLALRMQSSAREPFLAPWWLSPAIAYWSGQPGVAGSSHESLPGVVDSARFFSAAGGEAGQDILRRRQVRWVVAYDADRLAESCGQILGAPVPRDALCYRLDQAPSTAPAFLMLNAQRTAAKLFQVVNNR